MKLMQRAGHDRFETTLIYIREAEKLGAGFGEPFPPLPGDLLPPPEVLIEFCTARNSGPRQSQKQGLRGWAQQGLNL